MTTDQNTLCYCFGVTAKLVSEHLSKPGNTYETLIETTGIGTKCTACLLDLDVAMQKVFATKAKQNKGRRRHPKTGLLSVAADETNTGYVINQGDVTTILRVVNRSLMFAGGNYLPSFKYRLCLFNEHGRCCATLAGTLHSECDMEIDFSTLPGSPTIGWYWISLEAQGDGYLGSLRPQTLLRGSCWAATYHSQLLSMADFEKFVMVRSHGGHTGAIVPLINPNNQPADVSLTLECGAFKGKAMSKVAANGMQLLEVDKLFGGIPQDADLLLSLYSILPTQKYIIMRHSSGALSLDHFPNKK
jgi:bacterioferritin-associated ferredoxin